MNLYLFSQGYIRHHYLMIKQGYPAITVDHSFLTQAKDILGRGIWLWQDKRPKQAVSLSPGLFKANAGDFSGSRMNLVVVVAVHFLFQDRANFFNGGQFLQGTSPDYPIL